jgi:translation initiation factor 2A
VITPTETHLLRSTPSDLLITTPPLAPRPSIRLKLDSSIRGLFLSNPHSSSNLSNPVKPHAESSVAIWIGERNGAPANVGLYTLSSLLGKNELKEGGEIVVRDMPISGARKAFYKADKLNVKWNPAGTMVSDQACSQGKADRT